MNIQQLSLVLKQYKVTLYLVLLAIFGYLSTFIFNLVLTHYLTPTQFGDVNLALRVLLILATLSLLGTNISSTRFMSQYLRLNQDNELQGYIHWNTRMIRVSFSICVILAIVSYAIMHLLHIWHIKDIRTYHLTIYMLWLAPLASILNLLSSYLLTANSPVSFAFINNAREFSFMMFFIIIVILFDTHDIDSLVLLGVLSSGILLLIVISILLIIKKSPHLFLHISQAITLKQRPIHDPDWLFASRRLALNGLFYAFIFSTDLIILKIISPHAEVVGFYAVVLTIATSLIIIPQNIYAPIKPQVAHLLSSAKGKIQLEAMIRDLNRVSGIITLVITILLLVYSKTLLRHFGVNTTEIEPILHILMIGFIIGATAQPAKTVLVYAGYESALLMISIIELCSIIIFGIVLTYFWDITGIAIATSITILIRALLFHSITYQKTRVKPYRLLF